MKDVPSAAKLRRDLDSWFRTEFQLTRFEPASSNFVAHFRPTLREIQAECFAAGIPETAAALDQEITKFFRGFEEHIDFLYGIAGKDYLTIRGREIVEWDQDSEQAWLQFREDMNSIVVKLLDRENLDDPWTEEAHPPQNGAESAQVTFESQPVELTAGPRRPGEWLILLEDALTWDTFKKHVQEGKRRAEEINTRRWHVNIRDLQPCARRGRDLRDSIIRAWEAAGRPDRSELAKPVWKDGKLNLRR